MTTPAILDMAAMTVASAPGTGTITLGSALPGGFLSFQSAGAVDGGLYVYTIIDGSNRENGFGTYSASATTLTRNVQSASVNGVPQTTPINASVNAVVQSGGGSGGGSSANYALQGNIFFNGGRLTLVSGQAVMTSNETAQTTIFWTPFVHNLISLYNGTQFVTLPFSQTSVVLDTTNVLSGKLYDLFVFLASGVPTLGYGPAWTSLTARSAAITQSVGPWTNSASITLRVSSSSTFTVSANQAIYVGTFFATANGQTGMQFTASAAGGGGNILGLFNAQNQVLIGAYSRDTTASWSYSSTTWRKANNNANNSISYVDGLGICSINAVYNAFNTSLNAEGNLGVVLNWSSGAPLFLASADNTSGSTATAIAPFLPVLGFNVVNAIENSASNSTATTFDGNGYQQLSVFLNM